MPRPCTTFLGKTLTYREIGAQVDRATLGLQRLGVRKGTKVGLFLPNSPTFIVFFFAVLKAGGTVVNFNPLYTVAELTHQVKDSDTELMVTLDLQVLFGKVEALLEAGCLKRAVVASFPALLPVTKAILFRLFRVEGAGAAAGTPRPREKIVLEAEVMAGDGHAEKVAIDPAHRRCGAAVHRRDDGDAERRHAHACQLLRECTSGGCVEPRSRERHRAGIRCPAVLPRVCADGGDECRHQPGRAHHHHAALRAR